MCDDPTPTKREIYDEVCNMQTRVEDGYYEFAYQALEDALEVLRMVQTYWETVITAEENHD